MKGLNFKRTSRGLMVATLHYSADPTRDEKWVAKKRLLYSKRGWNREQEISYEEPSGEPVFDIMPEHHFKKVKWIEGKPFWRGWDFGFRNPACIVTQMNPFTDQWVWYWGIVGRRVSLAKFAPRVFEICDSLFPPTMDGRGKLQRQRFLEYVDPYQGNQVNDKSDTNSIEHLDVAHVNRYEEHASINQRRISFEDGADFIRQRLLLRNDGQPGLLIDSDFELGKDAMLGGYHFPADGKSGRQKEYPEDDGTYIHLMDAARYIANCVFEKEEPSRKAMRSDDEWSRLYANLDLSLDMTTGY